MKKLIHITAIKYKEDYKLVLTFSDGLQKTIDFSPFIKDDPLTSPLKNKEYFTSVKTYEGGRGIYWPNEYDFCPDFLYRYENIASKAA